jgi:hypothetical protein
MAKTKAETKPAETEKPAANGAANKKSAFPMTKKEFMDRAKPVKVTFRYGDEESVIVLGPKQFSSGGVGFFASEKITLTVGDIPVKLQAGINLVGVNSKDADDE